MYGEQRKVTVYKNHIWFFLFIKSFFLRCRNLIKSRGSALLILDSASVVFPFITICYVTVAALYIHQHIISILACRSCIMLPGGGNVARHYRCLLSVLSIAMACGCMRNAIICNIIYHILKYYMKCKASGMLCQASHAGRSSERQRPHELAKPFKW